MVRNKWLFISLVLILTASIVSCRYLIGNFRDTTDAKKPALYMEIRLEPIDARQSSLSKEDMTHIKDVMERRINALGVSNSSISVSGNIIKIELPGYSDMEQAKKVIVKTGELQFMDEDGGIIVTGKNLKSSQFAYQSVSEGGIREPVVQLTFDAEGTKLFANGTKANIGKTISISLDGQILMAPKVNSAITDGKVIITFGGKGEDIVKTAQEYASILQGGSIPASIVILKAEIR